MNYTKTLFQVFMRDITTLGGGWLNVLLLLFLLSVGQVRMFLLILAGVLIIYFIAIASRLIYFKERPAKESYSNVFEKLEASAFPSIHSARAAFYSVVLSYNLPSAAVLFGVTAAFVCYSRIHLKKHDYWDVLGGIVLGVGVGLISQFYF